MSSQPATPQAELLSVNDLARVLNVSVRTVWSLRYAGRLPAPFKLGGSLRWRRATIDTWICELEQTSSK